MSRKRLITMVLAVVSALALMAPAAQAADDTFAVSACVLVPGSVDGNTTVPSVQSDLADADGWDPLGLLDTETGTFDFEGPAVCGGVDAAGDNDGGNSPDAIVGTFNITASGTFVNLICGTGSANGTATLSDGVAGGTTINTTFSISFFAGVGTLSIVVDSGNADGVLTQDNTISGGSGLGVIDIAPQTGSCGTGPGVTAFLVNGGFVATLQGDSADA